MQIKLLVSAAAIALVAGVGSASADDEFETIEGLTADVITPQEMAMVIGSQFNVTVPSGATIPSAGHTDVVDGIARSAIGTPGVAGLEEMSPVVDF